MDGELEWWVLGGTWYDRRLRHEISEAQSAAAYASASAAADRREMAARLQRQSGSLQAQIDKLTKAFIAFVEYEDIRGELGQHAAESTVRRHAREVVGRRLGRDVEISAAPPDVPGYWLAPAARLLDPAASDPASDLAAALARDPRRAGLFLTLVASLTKDRALAEPYVASLLPATAEVSRAGRVVWAETAAGTFGEAACTALEAALGRIVASAPADVVRDWVAGRATTSASLPQEAGAAGLARLRQRLETSSSEEDAQPLDVLGLVVNLVDEGAPGEAEILERMRAVRGEMGFAAGDPVVSWDTPSGDVVELLLADLSSPDPGLRRVAQQVLGPLLEAEADRLVTEASVAVPVEETIVIEQQQVVVRSSGPADSAWRAWVLRDAERTYAPPRWTRPAAYACLGLAIVLLVLVLVHWAFVLPAFVAAGAGAWLLVRHRSDVRAGEAQVRHRVDWFSGRVDKATAALVDKQTRSAAAAHAARADREAVASVLRGHYDSGRG